MAQTTFTFMSQGHAIRIECALHCKESVFYDGIEVAAGWSATGGTYSFVVDEDNGEVLGDLSHSGQRLLVARGGFHGLGNTRFKSSTNRAPRQTTPGSDGARLDRRATPRHKPNVHARH